MRFFFTFVPKIKLKKVIDKDRKITCLKYALKSCLYFKVVTARECVVISEKFLMLRIWIYWDNRLQLMMFKKVKSPLGIVIIIVFFTA